MEQGGESQWVLPHPRTAGPPYPRSVLGPRGSVIGQGDDVVLDALVLQLLDVFRHRLFCAEEALGLGHGGIGHRCQGRGEDGEPEAPEARPGSPWSSGSHPIPVTAECAAASSWACVTSCWPGDTGTYWI